MTDDERYPIRGQRFIYDMAHATMLVILALTCIAAILIAAYIVVRLWLALEGLT